MDATLYATTQTVTDWATSEGNPLNPDEITPRLLHAARVLVRTYLAGRPTPTDPTRRQAVLDAQAAQIVYWTTTGIDPHENVSKAGTVVASAALLGGSMTFADTTTKTTARANAAGNLCPEALLILAEAGLSTRTIRVIG
ncbi:hypothetical protein [Actinobaculum sp. 352]|uniref:hypothetical protein n=1 Tax=Actinobaculum sp. 352 TaxID=2490946 RepID=UPI000F7D7E72|nr:hypothetical protein [Actinobaculum sp. 352]RTE47895.1 hypothetical protein EKN07_11590 [Actinobaculum sp. 352]